MGIEVRNDANAAEVYIYDDIGGGFFGGVTLEEVKNAFNELKGKKNITVRINSPGGDMFEGIAIYNFMRGFKSAKITSQVEGLAASAASIIALGADSVKMSNSAFMMIHNSQTRPYGDRNILREVADQLEQFDIQLRRIYSAKTGLSIDEVSAMMDKETWLNAEEAVESGFSDEMTETLDIAAYCNPDEFKQLPDGLKIRAKKPSPAVKNLAADIAERAKNLRAS